MMQKRLACLTFLSFMLFLPLNAEMIRPIFVTPFDTSNSFNIEDPMFYDNSPRSLDPKQIATQYGTFSGDVGMFFQLADSNNPTMLDLNTTFFYLTPTFRGFSGGASIDVAVKLYERKYGDFNKIKNYFILNELFADYFNEQYGIGVRAGRYKINEEWITHYNQGLSVYYSNNSNMMASFTYANANAYVTDYETNDFKPAFGFGSFFFNFKMKIPNTPVEVNPYFYTELGNFYATALKMKIDAPITTGLKSKNLIHILSHVEQKTTSKGSGAFLWLESLIDLYGNELGLGVLTVSSAGLGNIDAYGNQSRFIKSDGMFSASSTTGYTFLKAYILTNMWADLALRGSVINSASLINWQVGVHYEPIKSIKIGLESFGVHNYTSIKTDYGNSYYVLRAYAGYKY